MATKTTSEKKPRKPRGKAIEQTAFMDALENDPAAAMMALADEAQSEWENKAPRPARGMIAAPEDDADT